MGVCVIAGVGFANLGDDVNNFKKYGDTEGESGATPKGGSSGGPSSGGPSYDKAKVQSAIDDFRETAEGNRLSELNGMGRCEQCAKKLIGYLKKRNILSKGLIRVEPTKLKMALKYPYYQYGWDNHVAVELTDGKIADAVTGKAYETSKEWLEDFVLKDHYDNLKIIHPE